MPDKKHILVDLTYDELSKEQSCPFCNDSGFDLMGLKNHLVKYCLIYSELSWEYVESEKEKSNAVSK